MVKNAENTRPHWNNWECVFLSFLTFTGLSPFHLSLRQNKVWKIWKVGGLPTLKQASKVYTAICSRQKFLLIKAAASQEPDSLSLLQFSILY